MDRWQTGECGTYARVLQMVAPNLKVAVVGEKEHDPDVPGGGWWPKHYYAHDGTTAFDSLGQHPMPYMGNPAWGCDYLEDIAGEEAEDLPVEEGNCVGAALMHILTHDIYPNLTLRNVVEVMLDEEQLDTLGSVLLGLITG